MFRRRLLIALFLVGACVSTSCSAAIAGGPASGGPAAGGADSSGPPPGGSLSGTPVPAPAPGGPAGRGGAPAPVAAEGMLQVDRIDVQVLRSAPVQVQVRVQGMLLDGCTSLGPVSQRRQGSAVTVTIATVNTGASVCTQVAQLVDTLVRLEGSFPSGAYRVRVNGVERTFRVN